MDKGNTWSDVPDGFEFGWITTDQDLEELIALNDALHGPGTGEMFQRLIENQPGFGREMNYFIRDLDTGKIVSTMNAIPGIWSYKGVSLRNLELGFVGTLEAYRRRGLFNILYNYFDHLLLAGEYDVSSIQGIPFFYRQFGYDFILPLGRNITLQPSSIPTLQEDSRPPFMDIVVRESTESDISRLMELYGAVTSRLLVYAERDKQLWHIQERIRMRDDKPVGTMIVEHDGHVDGYFRFGERRGTSPDTVDSIFVSEASILSYDSVLRTLQFLKQTASNAQTGLIEVPGDKTTNLAKIILAYGGVLQRGWKYQIRIPDLLRFLNKIRPVIEYRLKGTMYERLTREIEINIYRTCFRFKFMNGQLRSIEDIGMQPTDTRQPFRLPPPDFIRLVLGDYSIEELRSYTTDFTIHPGKKHLLETLFPNRPSYLYNYQV